MKKVSLLLTLFVLLFLVACGGDGGGEEVSALIPVTYNYRFTNEFVYDPESFTVPADTPVTINLDNSGATLSHSWVLVPAGSVEDSATMEEIEAVAIVDSGEVVAGEEKAIEFNAPPAGAYEFVCSIAGHLAGGMKGRLVVID